MSCMLLFLSIYKAGKELEYKYELKEEWSFKGEQTNDAPVKCLIELAKESGNPIETIYCIVSQAVYTEKLALFKGEEITTFEKFERMVSDYTKPNPIRIIPIGYDFKIDNTDAEEKPETIDDVQQRANYIYEQIEDISGHKSSEKEIYIDYTGGLRDTSLLMIAIIRYLEFKEISCKHIVYSDLKEQIVRNIHYTYNMFDMINGVSEFVGTGNARQLINFLEKSNIENKNVKNFIEKIKTFSDDISICQVASIENSVEDIKKSITELEKDESEDVFIQMFKTLIPIVKDKMYIGQAKVSALDLAQWCLENNMLQQAVTIYTEKVLFYYIDNNYSDFVNELTSTSPYQDHREIWEDFNSDKGVGNEYVRRVEEQGAEAIDIIRQGENRESISKKKTASDKIDFIKEDLIKKSVPEKQEILEKAVKALNNIKQQYDNNQISKEIRGGASSMESFINSLLNNGFIDFENKFKLEFKNVSKPILSLEYFENGESKPKLWSALKYYHAIRVIRNTINHAALEVDQTAVKIYLEKKGLKETALPSGQSFDFRLKREFIIETLKEAIAYSKEIIR